MIIITLFHYGIGFFYFPVSEGLKMSTTTWSDSIVVRLSTIASFALIKLQWERIREYLVGGGWFYPVDYGNLDLITLQRVIKRGRFKPEGHISLLDAIVDGRIPIVIEDMPRWWYRNIYLILNEKGLPTKIKFDLNPNAFDIPEQERTAYINASLEIDEKTRLFKMLATGIGLTGELLPAYYAKEVVKYILERKLLEPETPIEQRDIFTLHSFLISDEFDKAGKLRRSDVFVTAAKEEQPPHFEEVHSLVSVFVQWINSEETVSFTPLDLAYQVYYRLVRIHPFGEANGRICRLLANLILLRKNAKPMDASLLRHTLANKEQLAQAQKK